MPARKNNRHINQLLDKQAKEGRPAFRNVESRNRSQTAQAQEAKNK
jgi:hypothetical protein